MSFEFEWRFYALSASEVENIESYNLLSHTMPCHIVTCTITIVHLITEQAVLALTAVLVNKEHVVQEGLLVRQAHKESKDHVEPLEMLVGTAQ